VVLTLSADPVSTCQRCPAAVLTVARVQQRTHSNGLTADRRDPCIQAARSTRWRRRQRRGDL
jgi:hypothetical protein